MTNGTCPQVPGGWKRCKQDMVMEKKFRTRHRGQFTPETPGHTLGQHGALQGHMSEVTIPASDWYESSVYGANAEVLFGKYTPISLEFPYKNTLVISNHKPKARMYFKTHSTRLRRRGSFQVPPGAGA